MLKQDISVYFENICIFVCVRLKFKKKGILCQEKRSMLLKLKDSLKSFGKCFQKKLWSFSVLKRPFLFGLSNIFKFNLFFSLVGSLSIVNNDDDDASIMSTKLLVINETPLSSVISGESFVCLLKV